nr:hypothetical protein [Tanacetum cinerariifolium]
MIVVEHTSGAKYHLPQRLQLQSLVSGGNGSSSVKSSGFEKKRERTVERTIVHIDLSNSDYDTEEDDKEPDAKKKMVASEEDESGKKEMVQANVEKE